MKSASCCCNNTSCDDFITLCPYLRTARHVFRQWMPQASPKCAPWPGCRAHDSARAACELAPPPRTACQQDALPRSGVGRHLRRQGTHDVRARRSIPSECAANSEWISSGRALCRRTEEPPSCTSQKPRSTAGSLICRGSAWPWPYRQSRLPSGVLLQPARVTMSKLLPKILCENVVNMKRVAYTHIQSTISAVMLGQQKEQASDLSMTQYNDI